MNKRKNHWYRLSALILAAALLLVGCVGCGTGGKEPSASSGSVSSDTPVSQGGTADTKGIAEGKTITICASENIKVEDYNTNSMAKQIEEALGVNLEFTVLPAADYNDKLNVMVTGGDDLPDIIFKPDNASVDVWANEGAIIPLNSYYENPELSANIREACERSGVEIPTYLTSPDGNIYRMPAFGQSPNGEVWKKLWIYQPWLDQLGKEVPQTLEEYFEILKLVATTDLNGNGKADEIGLTGTGILTYNGCWFDSLMSSFIYAYDEEYRVLDNGEISFAYTTEEWKEGLKYLRQFFESGLIPTETLTQNEEQYKALLNSEDTTVFSFSYWNADLMNADLLDRKLEYTYINALEGPSGLKEGMYMPAVPTVGAVITADCKDPEAAFLVCDYMCNESISFSQRFGERGVDWDYWEDAKVDNKDDFVATDPSESILLVAYDDAAFWGSGTMQNRSFLDAGCYVRQREMVTRLGINVANTDPEEVKKREYSQLYAASTAAGQEVARKEVVSYLPLTVEESEQIMDIKTTLKTYLPESIAAFLSGARDIDKEWDAYLAELDQIGYKEVLEIYQAAYDRLYK